MLTRVKSSLPPDVESDLDEGRLVDKLQLGGTKGRNQARRCLGISIGLRVLRVLRVMSFGALPVILELIQ
jgi:hypothetical protein